jgi:hypothetical protein
VRLDERISFALLPVGVALGAATIGLVVFAG